MDGDERSSRSKWKGKHYSIAISKCRLQMLFGSLRAQLSTQPGPSREAGSNKDIVCRGEVRIMISIPANCAVKGVHQEHIWEPL